MMSYHKPELYKWKRKTDSKGVYSRSQKVATNDDIHDWIKKVEDASTRAAEETFGTSSSAGRSAVKSKISRTLDHVHEYDTTYSEAKELLTQWVDEKCDFESDYNDESSWTPNKEKIKREWDHLLDVDSEDEYVNHVETIKPSYVSQPDPFVDIDKQDDDQLVDNILQNLLKKEVVPERFINDLGLEPHKTSDPRMKMELRHKMVKENREKRERELEKSRREKHTRKQAHSQAKQILIKEDKMKELRQKQEENQIQKEMTKIRKELHEQRKIEQEQKNREKFEKEILDRQARDEILRQKMDEEKLQLMEERRLEGRRIELMKRLEHTEAKNATQNLKLLQKHFSVWYNLVLERRITMGKARAMSDWKCLLRAWNAWKAYNRAKRAQKEALQHEHTMKDASRKTQIASEHHKRCLLRKYFIAWNVWVMQENQEKESSIFQNQLHCKMSSFLEAAATGKLRTGSQDDKETPRSTVSARSMSVDSTKQKIDNIFAQPAKHRHQPPPDTSRSDTSNDGFKQKTPFKPKLTVPTEAWQITKRHVNLTTKQLASMAGPAGGASGGGDDGGDTTQDAESTQGEPKTKPSQFKVNSYENRHKTQLDILKKQQSQIQEQQRMIDELQYHQKQQMLQQQLAQQQLFQQQLNNVSVAAPTPGSIDNIRPNTVGKEKIVTIDSTRTNSTAKTDSPRTTARSGGQPSARSQASDATTKSEGKTAKYETWVKGMEDRAAERAKMKADRESQRKKKDGEKLEQLKREEDERLKKEEEDKRARIEARREQKRLEKQKDQEKQVALERMQELQTRADYHHKLSIMRIYGFQPWRRLVVNSRRNMEVAVDHNENSLLRTFMMAWHALSSEVMERKNNLAREMHQFLITKHCLNRWKKYGQHMSIQEEKAENFYIGRLLVKSFRAWSDYAADEKIAMWGKERRAKDYNAGHLVRTVFRAWRRLPQIIKSEQEKELRRAELRRKVTSILPDFEGLSLLKSGSP